MSTTTVERETRILPVTGHPIEARASEAGKKCLRGYGAVFNLLSEDFGGWREKINPVAFNRTLGLNNDFLVATNHNLDLLLGRTGAGTARVGADDVGLWYEVDVPDTQNGRDTYAQAERGDLAGSSFTFSLPIGGVRWSREGDMRIREIMECRLYELGPVVTPAYLDTTVAARSLGDLLSSENLNDENANDDDKDTRDTPTVNIARRRLRFAR